MDLFDSMERVAREPRMVNLYDSYAQGYFSGIMGPSSITMFQHNLPNDGLIYVLDSIDVYPIFWFGLGGYPGPLQTWLAFAFNQSAPSWIYNAEKYVYGYERIQLTRQGALALSYPGCFGCEVNNNSNGYIGIYVVMMMFSKYPQE